MNNKKSGLILEKSLRNGSTYTSDEIYGQPELWVKTFKLVKKNLSSLKQYIDAILWKDQLQIILTGAGTSAYIGEVLAGPMQKHFELPVRAIPTTDIVTHPELYFLKNKPTLLISFARSGNSPESVKAVELANIVCDEIYHLIITCNKEGKLAINVDGNNDYVFLLPAEADDKSLAMTGSFSSMLLTGLLIANMNKLDFAEKQVDILFKYGKRFLSIYLDEIKKIAKLNFYRAVFLGSGLLGGIARESHLKLQELTDGKIICKHDTFLGFRHGPKAVIDDKTLLVYLFSNNEYSQNYEMDLVTSVNDSNSGCFKVGVMEKNIKNLKLDSKIIFSENEESIEEEFLTVVSILFAQTLGFYKSLELGLKPDSPSDRGMIHRVVQGVNLYKYNGAKKRKKV